jgi:predicted  nucleic acid-binding Zn-ribbon protein
MHDQLALLYQLQQLDTGIDRHQRNIAGLDDGTQVREKLARAQAELGGLQKKLADDEAAMKDRELQLTSAEQEIAQKRKRAQASASNPREIAALDRKVEELTRHKGKLEEDILVLMDEVELGRARAAEQQKAADKLATQASESEATYTSARKRLKGELAELAAKREELVPQIDKGLLAQYESIRERNGGLAIVDIRKGMCGGCQTAVPTSNIAAARNGKTPVKCESCRRILFVPE